MSIRYDKNTKVRAVRLVREQKRELRELRRKCRELESTIEIPKAATGFFVR